MCVCTSSFCMQRFIMPHPSFGSSAMLQVIGGAPLLKATQWKMPQPTHPSLFKRTCVCSPPCAAAARCVCVCSPLSLHSTYGSHLLTLEAAELQRLVGDDDTLSTSSLSSNSSSISRSTSSSGLTAVGSAAAAISAAAEGAVEFYSFPTLAQLSAATEQELRDLGQCSFAKYEQCAYCSDLDVWLMTRWLGVARCRHSKRGLKTETPRSVPVCTLSAVCQQCMRQ
jgi:hypothetical protein